MDRKKKRRQKERRRKIRNEPVIILARDIPMFGDEIRMLANFKAPSYEELLAIAAGERQ